jgi:F-type H+-transporting ATPase subunit gamma
MATLKAIRKRISSIRNTQQITKAMKMVSAAKLRRAQRRRGAPYAEKMTDLLRTLRLESQATPTRCSPCVKRSESSSCC